MQHPATTVLHETFADPFYFGPDAKVRDASSEEADAAIESSGLARDKTYAAVIEELMGAGSDGKRGMEVAAASCGSEFWQAMRSEAATLGAYSASLEFTRLLSMHLGCIIRRVC
jgi:hypothetical protein